MKYRVRFAVVALAVVLATTTFARQSGPARPSTAAVDKVLADAVARGDVPGVVAMATDRRGIVYQGAFGVAMAAYGFLSMHGRSTCKAFRLVACKLDSRRCLRRMQCMACCWMQCQDQQVRAGAR